jgi:hypothetical protein
VRCTIDAGHTTLCVNEINAAADPVARFIRVCLGSRAPIPEDKSWTASRGRVLRERQAHDESIGFSRPLGGTPGRYAEALPEVGETDARGARGLPSGPERVFEDQCRAFDPDADVQLAIG